MQSWNAVSLVVCVTLQFIAPTADVCMRVTFQSICYLTVKQAAACTQEWSEYTTHNTGAFGFLFDCPVQWLL
jgi:hypothetical protein